MSVDIFVQYFKDGKSDKIQMSFVHDIFAPYIIEKSEDMYNLYFDKLDSSYIFFGSKDENNNISGFCINRPCTDERMWKCIYESLSLGNGVLICPGMKGMLVNRDNVHSHIPKDMIENLGGIKVINNFQEFLEILKKW